MTNKILWVVIFLVFGTVGYRRLDPDFGWHLQMGNYILKQGVPLKDPFSYTMPSFPFIDHEWLTNVVFALAYPAIGKAGLAAVFVGLAVLVLVRQGRWAWIPVTLGAMVLLDRGGVRPQVIDWVFLAGLIWLFEERERWVKWRWVVPVMFGVWTNLHGGFALGPAILGFILVMKWGQEREVDLRDGMAWILGVAATGINPYGFRIWEEVGRQMSDTHLRWNIAEWQPFFMQMQVEFGLWMLAALAFILGWRYRKEMPWWRMGVVVGLFAASLSSVRHGGLFAVVAVSVVARGLERFYKEVPDKIRAEWFYKKVLGGMVGIVVVYHLVWTGWDLGRGLTEEGFYPKKAVEYLKGVNLPDNIFSEYGWGGYLIWKLPGRKQFIDGRMPSWRDNEAWAFKEWLKVAREGKWEEVFDKYQVKTVLWPVAKRNELGERLKNWLARWGFKYREEKPGLAERLAGSGWKEVYRDEVGVVLVKL